MTTAVWLIVALLSAPVAAAAQTTGGVTWTFNFDASWGTFGFGNSLYNNPKEGVATDLSDQWFEGAMKGGVTGVYTFASSSQVYGTVSAVGERTYGSSPSAFGPDISSFGPEDLAIGWRSGKAVGGTENLFDFTIGRAQYRIGNGMLLWDGAAEGGSRGGYWTNARKAFEFAAIARVQPGAHRFETFYLDRDELDENDLGTRLAGGNYEFRLGDHSTFGGTYFQTWADALSARRRDGMHVFNVRAYTAPFPALRALAFEAEYASEQNGERIQADAWTGQGGYTFESASWSPRVSYRYATFSGDDPTTSANEAFDPLLPGFSDWGSWWQGEIAGEYAIANSNLASHMLRLHVEPRDTLSGGLMVFRFVVDQPATFGEGVTARELATEADLYADWQITDRLTASFVLAFADPHAAAEQAYGRTKNFRYGMVFLAFSY